MARRTDVEQRSYSAIHSRPKDFTPICTTELVYMAKLKPEFDTRGVRIIGLSVDPVDKHHLWAMIVYPMITGRNFDGILRVVDSLQLTARHRVSTPVNWRPGEDVIIAGSVTNDEAKALYPEGWREPKPYMRIVPQPAPAGG